MCRIRRCVELSQSRGDARGNAVWPPRALSVAWDTTVASRLFPGNDHEQHLLERAAADDPVALTAPTILEIAYGLAKAAPSWPSGEAGGAWFTRLATSDLVVRLPLDASAAVVAGRLRAAHPTPPTGARRAGTKPEQRAGWLLDLQIAACAWSHGHAIATDNRRDLDVIAGLIAGLYPTVPALEVVGAPAL